MRDSYHDTETFSRVPIKDGSFKYAEDCEVMVWSFALEDGPVYVWDLVNFELHWIDDFSGAWVHTDDCYPLPDQLAQILNDQEDLIWFQNGGMFDFPVIDRQLPEIAKLMPMARRRDTMVQFFAHGLPGSLEKIGVVLKLEEDERKLINGKKLIHLFCKPQNEAFQEKYGTDRATKKTHPIEWQKFIEYAAQDIVTMRTAHKKTPMWNYRGKQVELCHLDWKINERGFQIDMDLVRAAISASDREKTRLAKETSEKTGGEVQAATQRDALLDHILKVWGVDLPDMQSDTLERRMEDPDLPQEVKELLGIRLASSMNSVSKYKRLLRGVSSDNRLRGGAQFRGAGRTGRWAHRLFQHGNLPRPKKELKPIINVGIEALKLGCAEIVVPDVLDFCRSAIRGSIIAAPGKKLIIADLANIEGRKGAWIPGENWKLQAFKDYDTIIPGAFDSKGEPKRKGVDLYIKAYMASFNVTDPVLVTGDDRQIGKVQELMFQYGGGVGAWLTGAATYGIHLDKMTEAVWSTLPQWAKDEATHYLYYLYEPMYTRHEKRVRKMSVEESEVILEEEKLNARHSLTEKVWVTCDAIKRLWRAAHPAISSYWKELEEGFRYVVNNPSNTVECRRVRLRRDGAWVRIQLPSNRVLCYLNPKIEKDNSITCTGFNQFSRKWERIKTYGGKLFENIIQAAACDQLSDGMLLCEQEGYEIVGHVHDEVICEVPDTSEYTVEAVCQMITADFGWNHGVPLAAAGFETDRYRKD